MANNLKKECVWSRFILLRAYTQISTQKEVYGVLTTNRNNLQ